MTLASPSKFFESCRTGVMGPTLDDDEVSGANVILSAMAGAPLSWCAYALATAWHETAHTMQPIHEMGGPNYFFRLYDRQGNNPKLAARLGNTENGDGVKYHGRGYVQLTGRGNYAKASAKLGLDLIGNPDLVLTSDIAAKIMRDGMASGWFTGKRLADCLPAGRPGTLSPDFLMARKIINGTDRASLIGGYAVKFQEALIAGGWA